MRAEHLQSWLTESTREERTDIAKSDRFIDIHYPDGVQGRKDTSVVYMVDGVNYAQGQWRVLGGWSCRSYLEGVIGSGQPADQDGGEIP